MMTSALRKLWQLLLLLQLLSTVLVHVYVVTYLSSLSQRWSMNRLTLLTSSDDGGKRTSCLTLGLPAHSNNLFPRYIVHYLLAYIDN